MNDTGDRMYGQRIACTWLFVRTEPMRKKTKSNAFNRSITRHKKALFLPMDRASADMLCLHSHVALESIRQGKGDRASVHCMAQTVLLTGYLTVAGYGNLEVCFFDEMERQLTALIRLGCETGSWLASELLVEDLVVVVNEHDRQLRETRLQAVIEAVERLDKMISASVAKQQFAG